MGIMYFMFVLQDAKKKVHNETISDNQHVKHTANSFNIIVTSKISHRLDSEAYTTLSGSEMETNAKEQVSSFDAVHKR